MSSPSSNPHAELSASQASFVYWLNGLAPVATNIVTPLIVYWNMKKQPQSLVSKYNVQVNEVVRQLISGTIGLVSYFGGGELARALVNGVLGSKRDTLDDATKQVAMITGGVVTSFLGFAFVRPYISTELICKFLKREEGADALAKPACIQSKHWLLGPVQRWVDRHLVPNGQPDLAKAVRYSTAALTGYLGVLTLGLWGINRALGDRGKQTAAPTVRQPQPYPPAPVPNRLSAQATTHPIMMGSRPAMPFYAPMPGCGTAWRRPGNGLTQVW